MDLVGGFTIKKRIAAILTIIFIGAFIGISFTLFGCTWDQNANEKEKYTMNATVSLGTVDDSLDKTVLSYEISINGDKEDIDNIDSQEPLINMEAKSKLTK